jgi:hypothetical protein
MPDFRTINAGENGIRCFAMLYRDRQGQSINAGDSEDTAVSYHLKALDGAHAGKWWNNSLSSWGVSDIDSNEMSYEVGGEGIWTFTLGASPFVAGTKYAEYAIEAGHAHVANVNLLACITPFTVEDISAALVAIIEGATWTLDPDELSEALVAAQAAALVAGEMGYTAEQVANFKKFIDSNVSERSIDDFTTVKNVSIG